VDAWTSLTAGLGLGITAEPAELLGFLAARDAVLDRHAARDAAQEALAAEMAQQEAMRLRFALLMPEPECAPSRRRSPRPNRPSNGRTRCARNVTDSLMN
jgi:hypothetical protein